MLPITRQTLVSSSLLDRLMDDRPEATSEAVSEKLYDVSRYKQAVARDLEALLNTRSTCLDDDRMEAFPLTRNSLLLFGITDLSSLSLLNPEDRMFLRDSIRRTIERYEPRLTKVRVNLEISRELNQVLRFRVDALLRVHPSRPPVTFDALLQLSSNTYHVKD
jgi:type VI secretion system protein ImpF